MTVIVGCKKDSVKSVGCVSKAQWISGLAVFAV